MPGRPDVPEVSGLLLLYRWSGLPVERRRKVYNGKKNGQRENESDLKMSAVPVAERGRIESRMCHVDLRIR